MDTRILIVDDEKEFTDALADRLTLRSYDVTCAYTGEEAVGKIKELNFDVVILDVQLPGVDGVEVLREIKNIKPLTEVIMLTGHATVDMAIEGMKLGAYDILKKPCETKELTTKIQGAKDRKHEHEERMRSARVSEIVSSPRAALK